MTLSNLRGKFLCFEGPDKSGKSTALKGVAAHFFNLDPTLQILMVREPGGTLFGEKVREVLLQTKGEALDPWAEALLFSAARIQLFERVIKPALQAGQLVLTDRWVHSTYAYQCAHEEHHYMGVARDLWRDIDRIYIQMPPAFWPHLTFILNAPPHELERRAIGSERDNIESRGIPYQERVRDNYARLLRTPINSFRTPDSTIDVPCGAADNVRNFIVAQIKARIG